MNPALAQRADAGGRAAVAQDRGLGGMAHDGMRLNGEELHQEANEIAESCEAVRSAAGVLATLADAIGHPQLAAIAREVAQRWEDARFAAEADAEAVAHALRTIADVAAQIDERLATAAAVVEGRRARG